MQVVYVFQHDKHHPEYSLYLEEVPGWSLFDRTPAWLDRGTFWSSPSCVKQMDHWFFGPLVAPNFSPPEALSPAAANGCVGGHSEAEGTDAPGA